MPFSTFYQTLLQSYDPLCIFIAMYRSGEFSQEEMEEILRDHYDRVDLEILMEEYPNDLDSTETIDTI